MVWPQSQVPALECTRVSIRKSVAGLLPGGTDDADKRLDGDEAETGDTVGTDAAGLYSCSSCGTTYISETMDTCPDCETAVESVPTEADLGMV